MLLTPGLPKNYWEEAMATVCYVQNRVPHATDPNTTPYFHWFGKPPNVQHLRIFGCVAYPVKALDLRKKLDATSTRMIFVGYGDQFGFKAYRLYNPAHIGLRNGSYISSSPSLENKDVGGPHFRVQLSVNPPHPSNSSAIFIFH